MRWQGAGAPSDWASLQRRQRRQRAPVVPRSRRPSTDPGFSSGERRVTPAAPAVDADPVAVAEGGGRHPGAQDRGQPVLPGGDGSVGEDSSAVGDDSGGQRKDRRPGGCRDTADEDLPVAQGWQLGVTSYDSDGPFGDAPGQQRRRSAPGHRQPPARAAQDTRVASPTGSGSDHPHQRRRHSRDVGRGAHPTQSHRPGLCADVGLFAPPAGHGLEQLSLSRRHAAQGLDQFVQREVRRVLGSRKGGAVDEASTGLEQPASQEAEGGVGDERDVVLAECVDPSGVAQSGLEGVAEGDGERGSGAVCGLVCCRVVGEVRVAEQQPSRRSAGRSARTGAPAS